jgi:hypothetical protein
MFSPVGENMTSGVVLFGAEVLAAQEKRRRAHGLVAEGLDKKAKVYASPEPKYRLIGQPTFPYQVQSVPITITASDSLDVGTTRDWDVWIDTEPGTYQGNGVYSNTPTYDKVLVSGNTMSVNPSLEPGTHTLYFAVTQSGGSARGTYSGTITIGTQSTQFSGVDVSDPTMVTFTVGGGTTPPTGSYVVSGTVTDSTTLQPLNGVVVTLATPSAVQTTSGVSGQFSFANVPAGTYTIIAAVSGYLNYQGAVTVSGNTTNVSIPMIPVSKGTGKYVVSGDVTDQTTGDAIGGASLTLGSLTTTADSEGGFEFEGVAAGTYTLQASAAGYKTGSRTISVSDNTSVGISLASTSGGQGIYTVQGNVTDKSTGNDIAGADVVLGTLTTTTDGNGNYVVDNVPTGSMTLTVSYTGYQTASETIDVTGNMVANVSLASTTTPPTTWLGIPITYWYIIFGGLGTILAVIALVPRGASVQSVAAPYPYYPPPPPQPTVIYTQPYGGPR